MSGARDSHGISLGPGEGEAFANPIGGPVTIKARDAATGGAFTVFESQPAPGEGPPLHAHEREDEFVYVLEGELRVKLEENLSRAPTGAFVFIPRGVAHTWQNVGAEQARILFAFSPAAPGMERFFERAAAVPAGTPISQAFGEFAADAGMRVLGPPLAQSDPI